MSIVLNQVEVRVLGSLIEKDITTPDYYPLSLNALVNACNQKNNRDPVMNLSEAEVRPALDSLTEKSLAGLASGAENRVTKYEHRLQEVFNFDRREIALLCELLLRGSQTLGELRSRAERMYRFNDLDEVQATLARLAQREPPLVKILPRQKGTKESRYVHLLGGDVEGAPSLPPRTPTFEMGSEEDERIAQLHSEIIELRGELADLRQQFTQFRKQFE